MYINGNKVTRATIVTLGTLALNLIGWGVTLGTILNEISNHDKRLNKVEHTNEEQWKAIKSAHASEGK